MRTFKWDDDGYANLAPGWQAWVRKAWHGKPVRKDRHPPAAMWSLWGPDSDHPFRASVYGEIRAKRLDDDGYALDDPMPRARDVAVLFLDTARAREDAPPHQHRRTVQIPRPPADQGPAKVLIGCCGKKLDKAAKPLELYQGSQFKMRAEWAGVLHGGVAGILSAKHGLVLPDQKIAPYDLTLTSLDKEALASWQGKVRAQVAKAFPEGTRIIVLAGKAYGGWQTHRHKVEHRRFGGIGYERKALVEEMAAARRGQTSLFEGAA